MRPLGDWVLVDLDPEAPRVTGGGIILTGEDPVRTATVLKVGKGRHNQKDGSLEPTDVKPGERVAFFIATIQTKQGAEVYHRLPDNQALIKESDVLAVLEEDIRITR